MRHLAFAVGLVILMLSGAVRAADISPGPTRTPEAAATRARISDRAASRANSRKQCDDARTAVQAQIDAACPCTKAENRGGYVRCVNDKLRELSACHKGADGSESCGPLPRSCGVEFRRTASRSTCGQPDAVTCCIPRQHDCVKDPTPGDGKKEGTCSRSGRPCDTLSDCRIPSCRQAASAERCTAVGGTVGNGKDCSTACAP
jgi:hypothetical protein